MTGWFPAKFVEILDERSKEVWRQSVLIQHLFSVLLFAQISLPVWWLLIYTIQSDWCFCVYPQYSLAGDDSVTEAVTDLARGTLCPALKAIFQHGLKKPSILGGPCHPWLFIEEVTQSQTRHVADTDCIKCIIACHPPFLLVCSQAASREVERDFNSVYSRLVLCKTYR